MNLPLYLVNYNIPLKSTKLRITITSFLKWLSAGDFTVQLFKSHRSAESASSETRTRHYAMIVDILSDWSPKQTQIKNKTTKIKDIVSS